MKTLTTTIARIIYAIPFFVFGILHFLNANAMAAYVPSFFPFGIFWIYLAGLGFIAASISIIIQVQTKLACLLLAGVLLIFILTMHIPGMMSGDMMKMQYSMSGLLKDMALAGGALLIAGMQKQDSKKSKNEN